MYWCPAPPGKLKRGTAVRLGGHLGPPRVPSQKPRGRPRNTGEPDEETRDEACPTRQAKRREERFQKLGARLVPHVAHRRPRFWADDRPARPAGGNPVCCVSTRRPAGVAFGAPAAGLGGAPPVPAGCQAGTS